MIARTRTLAVLALGAFAVLATSGRAATGAQVAPRELAHAGLEQKLDQQIPLDLAFRDETGKVVSLGESFGTKPVLLSFAYYHCPMLCPMVLDAIVRSLRPLAGTIGSEFNVVTIGIDPKETPAQAAQKKAKLLADYGRKGSENGWRFLVGEGDSVQKLAAAAGFNYEYDAKNDQFAHSAGIVILTPQGKISRYLYGIDYTPRDVQLSLVEASNGKIGTLADQILLFCYHYDPATGKYGVAAMTSLRIAGIATLLGLAGFVMTQIRRENSKA